MLSASFQPSQSSCTHTAQRRMCVKSRIIFSYRASYSSLSLILSDSPRIRLTRPRAALNALYCSRVGSRCHHLKWGGCMISSGSRRNQYDIAWYDSQSLVIRSLDDIKHAISRVRYHVRVRYRSGDISHCGDVAAAISSRTPRRCRGRDIRLRRGDISAVFYTFSYPHQHVPPPIKVVQLLPLR